MNRRAIVCSQCSVSRRPAWERTVQTNGPEFFVICTKHVVDRKVWPLSELRMPFSDIFRCVAESGQVFWLLCFRWKFFVAEEFVVEHKINHPSRAHADGRASKKSPRAFPGSENREL